MVYLRYLIMANKPRIRFRGFTEDWEQRKLESLFTKYEDKVNTPDSGYWRLGLRSHCKGTFHTYVDAGHELETTEMYRVKAGNFILNITFAWERALAVTDDEDQDKLVSHRFPQFKPNSDLVIDFFKHTLMDKRLKHHLELSSPGGAGRNKVLKVSDMLKYELLVPSIQEQNIISSFLNNIDHIITLHQCKLKKLNLAKKSLLQKLFPRNGSQIPGVRFKGFTDAWEQRKLGDLYKRVNERNDGTLGRDKWISVAKMYFQDPDKVQSNNLDTRTYVMKKGDIAFEGHPNNEFKFGRFVLNDIGTGIISELFPIYRPITEYDLDFWKYAIQLERVMAPILAKSITSSGNSSNKLDHNHFLNKELLVPNIEEQKKIGTLLSLLSKNITLHQRKLERLQEVKKGLLQKMFV